MRLIETTPRHLRHGRVVATDTAGTKGLLNDWAFLRANTWLGGEAVKTESTLTASTRTVEQGVSREDGGPTRTRIGRLKEFWARWLSNSSLGAAFGQWASRTIALPQLRRLTVGEIPWTPLRRPISDTTVVLISTGGVHLSSDRPFNLNSDSTFRVIPKDARPADLAITHQAYDRTDALRDINLVFPIERLRELESEHVIGRLAERHYGFGLMGSARRLMPSVKEVARRISKSGADLALLVPA
jgi:D-proline reductase (dithiol) PrdB